MTPDLLTKWPVGSTVRGVRFAAGATGDGAAGDGVLLSLPAPVSRHAVAVELEGQDADLRVLTIPIELPEPPDLLASIKAWLSPDNKGTSASPVDPASYHFVHLHGAQVHWTLPRVVVVAPPDRMESVLRAALEAAYLETELQRIELGLTEIWPAVEQDAPRAFQFRGKDLKLRAEIGARFQAVARFRSQLSRIIPRLLVPPAYPPTLASQVLERFRERLGVGYRVDALNAQLEMFERIYEGCSQRSSEFALARKGLLLEWLIIVLLAVQTTLIVIELINARQDREREAQAAAAAATSGQQQTADPEEERESGMQPTTQPSNRSPSNRSNFPQRRPFRRP